MTDEVQSKGHSEDHTADKRVRHQHAADQAHAKMFDQFMVQGIDISHFNGEIRWGEVKKSGVQFVYIKASEGANKEDGSFALSWKQAKESGIVRGAYHVFNPNKPVRLQVDAFVAALGRLEPGDLPPALDLEFAQYWKKHTPKENADKVIDCLKLIKERTGMDPVLYMSRNIANTVL